MLTHNTHYATKQDKVIPSSGLTFFVICYTLPNGNIRWVARNRHFSLEPSSAARFFSFQDAKNFVPLDFPAGRCEIVVFRWSSTSSCYFSSHSYTCLGGRSDCYAGHFQI